MPEPTGDDFGQFLRDLLNRFDRSWRAIDRRLDAQAVEMRAQAEEMRARTAAIHDMRDQIQANTRAVLHVLDELRGAEGGA